MSWRPPSFVILLLSLGAALCFSSLPAHATLQDAIRIDVPEGVRVRIENQFGQVTAEAWKEKYVSVSASIESNGASFKRSPIVIERKYKLLLISVIRRPIDPQVQINLTIKLPESAQSSLLSRPRLMLLSRPRLRRFRVPSRPSSLLKARPNALERLPPIRARKR